MADCSKANNECLLLAQPLEPLRRRALSMRWLHVLASRLALHVVARGSAERVPLGREQRRDSVRHLDRTELLARAGEVHVVPALQVACGVRLPCGNKHVSPFHNFSYACPEPVLAKVRIF